MSMLQENKQLRRFQHDKHAVDRDISVGDDVFVRNFSLHGGKWLPGLVVECTGPLSYKVKTATHGIVRRHQDQIQTSVHHYTEDPISDSLVNEDLTLPQGHRPRSLSVDSDPKDNSVQEQITSPSQQRIAEEETRESSHDFGREIEKHSKRWRWCGTNGYQYH